MAHCRQQVRALHDFSTQDTRTIPNFPRHLVIVMLGLLMLAACSAPRLTYDRLDWIAGWKLGDYVKLDREQKAQFDPLFQAVWDWHRAEQLPLYAEDLQTLSTQVASPLTAEDLLAWQQRGESHWDALVQHIAPQACGVVATLSDEQRDSILRRLDKGLEEDRERHLERSEAEVRERAGKRLLKSLERWAGKLTDGQREQALAWNQHRALSNRAWIERRTRWRDRFAQLLQARHAPNLCAELEQLFLRGPADGGLHRVIDAHNLAWRRFLSDFANGLQAQQRQHLQIELAEWREDFQALAARAAPDPKP